jgi:aryl-alcohol dehydrogenase-like predicted oxidoreductase
MQHQRFGRTGLFVSRICLGSMTFGGANVPPYPLLGALSAKEAGDLVAMALDVGVNFFDTADVYAAGESEQMLGQALGARRDQVVLATKGHARVGKGPNDVGQSRCHLMRAVEASLKRLGTDHIDLYQLHNFDPFTPLDEVLRTLDDLVRRGLVRYIGCSNFAAWQVMKALGVSAAKQLESFVSVQAYYSLAGRDLERELLPMIADQGLALMVWSPLAGGLLAGKRAASGTGTGADPIIGTAGNPIEARRTKVDFPPVDPARIPGVVEALERVGARHDASAARVALAWLMTRPEVTSVIVGARTSQQLADNLAAIDLTLTAEDLLTLDEASRLPASYPDWIHAYGAPGRLPRPHRSAKT